MTSPEFTITDIFEALPGKEAEVRQRLLAVVDSARRVGPDFGMIGFDLHRNRANPSQFLLHQRWTTKAGFDEYDRTRRPAERVSFLKEAGGLLTEALEDVSSQWEMISAPSENRAAIAATAFLDALALSDADTIAGLWTEDAVLEFPFAPEGFPHSVEGLAAIDKYFRDALAAVTPIAYPNRAVTPLADPDACVIEFGSQLTVGDDPTVRENSYITIVRVRGGKIAHFKEHYDSVKRVEGFPSASEMSGEAAEPPHTVMVRLRARVGAADELADLMTEIGARAAEDPGCQFYRVFRSSDDDLAFIIFEAWDRKADFDAHLANDWVAGTNKRLRPLVDGEIEAQAYTEL